MRGRQGPAMDQTLRAMVNPCCDSGRVAKGTRHTAASHLWVGTRAEALEAAMEQRQGEARSSVRPGLAS